MKFQGLFLLLLLCLAVKGNNVKVGGSPDLILDSDHSTIRINCTLSWENSWRDEFNWDAVWVFVKYKKEGDTGAWSHLNLSADPELPSGFTFDLGKAGAKNTGLFVFRDSKGGGPVNGINLTLKTTLSELGGATADDILNGNVYAAVSAIEMAYIPYGAYYLGDGASNNAFCDAEGAPVVLDSEAARTLYTKTNGSLSSASVSANYPKGYRGFYCMKYELSQEQYAGFLNMLSYDQQKARIGNDLDNLQKGDYIFGDKTRPSARNGIAVFAKQSGKPALFANNLNPAEPYYARDDGQTIPCNYLTPEDMLAYCDWCGLRPMSEMEYEKACRRFYPQAPAAREYAWNQTTYASIRGAGDLTGLNTEDESPVSPAKNVNVNNASFGPSRCGSFGFASSTQSQAGATFWGIMEMSGNTGELCYGIKATGFNTSDATVSHGDGTLNANGTANISTSYWPVGTTAGNFAIRGGSFASADTNLRVSDRTILSVSTVRDSSIGFRAVRTFGGNITVDPGAIKAANDTACWTGGVSILSDRDAEVENAGDMMLVYRWYVKKPGASAYALIPDESGKELNYKDFENTGTSVATYQFKRTVSCAVGDASTASDYKVYFFPTPFPAQSEFSGGSFVNITQYWGTAPAQWTLKDAPDGAYINSVQSNYVQVVGANPGSLTLETSLNACPEDVFTKAVSTTADFAYTGNTQSITLNPGTYKMECWGAGGGAKAGGNGGYAAGEITLAEKTTFYIQVGQAGVQGYTSTNYGGGGGTGTSDSPATTYYSYSGGGATDIRLLDGAWNNTAGLYSRIIVAGGGGGGSKPSDGPYIGGNGGGISGATGGTYSTPQAGGTQTSGFSIGTGGKGRNSVSLVRGQSGCGGGGGGYRGGYAQTAGGSNTVAAGGGGSGFVSGHPSCNAMNASGVNTGTPNHYSGYVFTKTALTAGVNAAANHGRAKISLLSQ